MWCNTSTRGKIGYGGMEGIRRVVMNHTYDVPLSRELAPTQLFQRADRSYYAEVRAAQLDEQSGIIDRLIDMAFETLGARHLDLRIVDVQCSACRTA
jgi:hypothetical protein